MAINGTGRLDPAVESAPELVNLKPSHNTPAARRAQIGETDLAAPEPVSIRRILDPMPDHRPRSLAEQRAQAVITDMRARGAPERAIAQALRLTTDQCEWYGLEPPRLDLTPAWRRT